MSGRIFIVFNARSGRPDDTVQASAERVLGGAGKAFELIEVAKGRDLPAAAAKAVKAARGEDGIVVGAGGDGTLNTVARAVLGSGCRFGIVPQGTFNYLARSHAIPLDNDAAMQILADGHEKPIQVGLVNDRIFLVNASVGLYPQLLEDREAYKQRFGRFRVVAWLSGLATVLGKTRQLHLEIDADGPTPPETVRTPTVFVGNNRLQLEQIGIADAASVDAGRLAVIVLKPVGTASLLGLVLSGALGRLGDADAARSFTTAGLTVARSRRRFVPARIKLATDGEVDLATLPLRFHISAEPLRLLVPRPKPEPA